MDTLLGLEDESGVVGGRAALAETAATLRGVVQEVTQARPATVLDEEAAARQRVRRASQEALQDISSQTIRTCACGCSALHLPVPCTRAVDAASEARPRRA